MQTEIKKIKKLSLTNKKEHFFFKLLYHNFQHKTPLDKDTN